MSEIPEDGDNGDVDDAPWTVAGHVRVDGGSPVAFCLLSYVPMKLRGPAWSCLELRGFA